NFNAFAIVVAGRTGGHDAKAERLLVADGILYLLVEEGPVVFAGSFLQLGPAKAKIFVRGISGTIIHITLRKSILIMPLLHAAAGRPQFILRADLEKMKVAGVLYLLCAGTG